MNITPLDILNRYYGYTNFRKGQEDIINSIINNNDVLAIMPTGGGKSICYQIPAMVLEGITIVVSPLISLMKDQVDTLKVMGIEAEYINSSLSNSEYEKVLNNIKNDKCKILYVAPERLDSSDFLTVIYDKVVCQVAIDEAHCVSQWGHDFRVSYKKIPYFINNLRNRPIVTAFTATASDEVRKDIVEVLNLNNPKVFISGFDRENLSINIIKSPAKNKYLLDYVKNHENECGIIYASTRKEVENIHDGLLKRGYLVSKYHAGLSNEIRKENQEKFINDDIKIMVATNAFGMGIDKPNIRWVIHYNMPQSIENYYQEIGRAGRDGEESECILLFAPQDIHTQKYLVEASIENPQRKIAKYTKLQQMVDLIYTSDCYRKCILDYFGETMEDECNNCSNCLNDGEVVDKTLDAMMVISCIARMKRSYGITMIVDVLRGSKNKKVLELEFDKLSTYGLMKKYSSEDLKNFINTLVSHGFLDIVENLGHRGTFPTIKLNEQSMRVIKKEIKVELKEAKASKSKYVENELYEELVSLRSNIAREESIAPYMVFGDATLKGMASIYATSKEEMLSVSGIGEVKYEKYGSRFKDVIESYINRNNIDKQKVLDNNTNKKDNTKIKDEYFEVTTDKDLYNILDDLRKDIAKKEKTIPYMVISKNSLKEISGRYPTTKEQLKDIGGMGPVKINRYGESILDVVNSYINEKNIRPEWEDKKRLKLIIDGENRKNNEIALDLLNQGNDIKYVCEEIETSLSTVLGYIYDYIKEGNCINFNIDLESMYEQKDKAMILDACERFSEDKISVIKKLLPDYIKYENIRAVILEKYI
ncbi:DNA helicase RecQ [Romboutsia sp. 1001216sp1]|uniref:DNA helicase RecQ n=1 Tax=unclassified Romboutsia TaxID=2626894 RepID=UPI0018AA72C9|nr:MULTISPECIES: DNA helicase RecQ [unclassified Romboutsia]MDB8793599.1 DNA helicase RecQ [Romboutsia sp. 1001216sp1]MDB8794996.1 DNA helicase RecQ [Romboutsia sp. 1001216sp1]MDB8798807.1 DNA helicase RecQ [Romboutsia sp. 1001216sp1]